MQSRILLPLLLVFSANLLRAQVGEPDGPYLVYQGEDLVGYWTWPEERRADSVRWADHAAATLPDFPGFRASSVLPDQPFRRSGQVDWQNVKKVAALSDIHGQYETARKLLQAQGIIDEERNWAFGEGHLVIVGDVFDRGDQVNATLWMIHDLQQQAEAAGGKVHFLLGNHETMVLAGDIRYIHKRYLLTTALVRKSYQSLYGPDTYLGRWLRSLPLTVRINNVVYVHGGFSPDLLKEVSTLQKINDTYHEHLIDVNPTVATCDSPKLKLLHGANGPLWYRGYFVDSDFTDRDVDRILKKVEAEHLVVGHTSFDAVKSYFGGKVLAVDSSIKFGSIGEVLLIEDGKFWRGDLHGGRLPLLEAVK
ncbi:metallophosphoesterase [Neolewinella lacunae]|uniref:Metallophosphoesterase n=1 Tax=Neolewinella lacunae TaxID=1517758 RepID=A0A923T964_9BACT|nr:metallophosphoesterase [Neolewinella lacunae]MBC6994723.1 metallophosphoesterase [Neolewinella lacunae]MDN3634595.1 metallophosphoesterase [Neolewinella lacunae]